VQVTINPLSDIQQEADIQVSNEELQPHFDQAYEKFRPKVELRGFRKGKVPMPMIRQLYGEAIENEALDTIANDLYRRAMEEKNIRPIGQPTMVDMDFKRGEEFRFRIKYEVKPAIALGRYKGVGAERPVHAVTDEEVESEITGIRRANGTPAEAEAVTDPEHVVTGDVQELDEAGTPLIGKKTASARFSLWDRTLTPEIRNALLNARVGETSPVRFESHHGDHAHPVHLAIAVTKIEKMTLPAFDDELVAKITAGKETSASAFRANLRTDIEKYWNDQANSALDDNIARTIVDAHDFPVPGTLVEGLLDSFVDDVRERSRDRKLPKGFDEKKFREESRTYALWQAKWILIKEQIAAAEHLTVTDAEIEAMAEAEAVKIGVDKERLLQFYKKSSGATDRLLSDKIMTFLRTHAKVTETAAAAAQHS